MNLSIVILAAGKGSRMNSGTPKVLHTLAGLPMLTHVLQTAASLKPSAIYCIVGHGQDHIKAKMGDGLCHWVEQREQLGTAHAVAQALPFIKTERVLILCGDVPLMRAKTLSEFINQTPEAALGLITYAMDEPQGFGRIIRDNNQAILDVVEEKDATPAQRAIREVSSGIYLARTADLQRWIPHIKNQNAGGEYYLPDIVPMAVKETGMTGYLLKQTEEALGVNDKIQLAQAERIMQAQHAKTLMQSGVTLIDPARYDQRGTVKAGQDVVIDINCICEGEVVIGDRCRIGANVILRNVTLGVDCEILPHTIIDGAVLKNNVTVGPFARIRPGTVLSNDVKVGNFVEIKNTHMGANTKANHLSYLGDAQLGEHVNIGAGTITCNYDGVNKSVTRIADGAFIGSNASLVAPLEIGENAVIGAGSVITKDAPKEQLTVARAKQTTIPNWKRPERSANKED